MTNDAAIPSPRGRPKGDKRARTRARIIEAARALVQEKGYENTTLQEVARRAGMSNGAVYGNFKNRDDVFAAIGPTYWPRVAVSFAPGASFAEAMRAVAEGMIAALPKRRPAAPARLTGLAYTLTNTGLAARVEEITTARYAEAADWWRRAFPDESQLPMPPETLVRVLSALIDGLTFQKLLTPDLISDVVIHAAFAALASPRPG
jgi:AcrR family transcriptional regulator